MSLSIFFFNDTATTEIYTLSLHDALPISMPHGRRTQRRCATCTACANGCGRWRRSRHEAGHPPDPQAAAAPLSVRSEEHTSELQSRRDLVCRLLLEKKKKITKPAK